jgi:hypothetical protein
MSVEKVIYAAKATVGTLGYNLNANPDFKEWEVGKFPATKFNCWTSLLFWAFQGGEVGKGFLLRYGKTIELLCTQNESLQAQNLMDEVMGVGSAITLGQQVIPVAGSAIFFQTAGKPMAHVVLSDGMGKVISNDPFVSPDTKLGFNHIGAKLVPLETMTAYMEKNMRPKDVKHTPDPFWKYLDLVN